MVKLGWEHPTCLSTTIITCHTHQLFLRRRDTVNSHGRGLFYTLAMVGSIAGGRVMGSRPGEFRQDSRVGDEKIVQLSINGLHFVLLCGCDGRENEPSFLPQKGNLLL